MPPMETGKPGAGARRRLGQRWMRVLAAVVVVLAAIVVITPFLVNAETFRPLLEREISGAVGRQVTLGHLSFSLLSGSLTAKAIRVADNPAFQSGPFLQAKAFKISLSVGALLFRRKLNIKSFVAESPVIRLVSNRQGIWNFSTLGQARRQAPANSSRGGSASNAVVGDLRIRNGTVIVSSAPATGAPFVYRKVNVTVQNLSYQQPMPFSISADLPGSGRLRLSGSAGPINRQNAMATPLSASLAIQHFDPVRAGVLPASEGITMIIDAAAQAHSDGKRLTGSGRASAANWRFASGGTPAAKPLQVHFQVRENLPAANATAPAVIQVRQLTLSAGTAQAQVTGSLRGGGQAYELELNLAAPNLPIEQLEAFLPAFGIRLPRGSSLQGGTLNANLAIGGTTTAPVISGPVAVANTRLAGFDLGAKIQGLQLLRSMSPATQIRALRANVQSNLSVTRLTNLVADMPAIGTMTGSGTMSSSGALNFHLVAKLAQSSRAETAASQAATRLGGIAGSLLHTVISGGVPLIVTGNASDPQIRADVKALAPGGKKSNPFGGLKGLLKH